MATDNRQVVFNIFLPYWAYSLSCHIAERYYQNETITANNTVNKEGCTVMYCYSVVFVIKPIRTELNLFVQYWCYAPIN